LATGVYQIELNEKLYVGSTTSGFSKRWRNHLWYLRRGTHCNAHLQSAFNLYGEDALKFSIIEIVETPEEVIAVEQHYIDAMHPEYNMCTVAGNKYGVKCSDETKRKIGEAHRGKVVSEETRSKLSIANKGKPSNRKGCKLSDETRKKISEAVKGISEETRKRESESHKGHKHSDEQKQKISESLKLYWHKQNT